MMDFDKILHGFQPERFRRINLRQRHFYNMPGLEYYVRLDAYTAWLEEKLAAARETIAMSGNNYYMHDSKEWCKNWNAKLREIGELKAEKITLEAEKNAEIRRLQLENEWLQEKDEISNQKIADLQQQLLAYESTGTKIQRTRDEKGRFSSNMSKKEKRKVAYDMKQRGFKWAEIAHQLDIQPDTAKQYVEEYEREWREYRQLGVNKNDEQQDQSVITYG